MGIPVRLSEHEIMNVGDDVAKLRKLIAELTDRVAALELRQPVMMPYPVPMLPPIYVELIIPQPNSWWNLPQPYAVPIWVGPEPTVTSIIG